MKGILPVLCVVILLLSAGTAFAQVSTGTIEGRVASSLSPEKARIDLYEVTTESLVQSVHPDTSGKFAIHDLPYATYEVYLYDEATKITSRRVTVSSPVPITVVLDATGEVKGSEVTVIDTHLDKAMVGSHTYYTKTTIQKLPSYTSNKKIETVLLQTPGFVPDEDGRLHVRGEDAQLQYVIDGIPITANMTRIYANLFGADRIKSLDVQRGGLRAEYGVATSSVINITTKSGFDQPFYAAGSYGFSSFGTSEKGFEVGGNAGNEIGIYFTYNDTRSDRYLDPVSSVEPNHTRGQASDYFGKANFIISDDVDAVLLGGYSVGSFEIPNIYLKSAQDQKQQLTDYLGGIRVNANLSKNSVLSLLGYSHGEQSELTSNGLRQLTIIDSAQRAQAIANNEKFFAGGLRKNTYTGGQLEYSLRTDWFNVPNSFKAGIGYEMYPLEEFFTFAVTNSAFSSSDSAGGDDRFRPYDITRGGTPFLVNQKKDGHRLSAFLQDEWLIGDWTIDAGVRLDRFHLFDDETAISPRLGAAYSLSDDLVLRGSYNRVVMQAPLENILVSSSDAARMLTGAAQGGVPTTVRSEKSHVVELGAGYRASRYVNFDLAAYGKSIEDFIVKVELGSSGIIFPANLKKGFVVGGEFQTRLHNWHHFDGVLSISTSIAKGVKPTDGSSPVSAGLILGEEGENYSRPFGGENSFPTEHNQLLTTAGSVTYTVDKYGLFFTLSGRFDSGLPFDLANKQGVGLSPEESKAELLRRGYTEDVIALLDLTSEMPGSPDKSVAPHGTIDLSAGLDLSQFIGFNGKVTASIINVLDTPYLYKFESAFGGTHFGQPRLFAVRFDLRY